jgi:hypothetical protein
MPQTSCDRITIIWTTVVFTAIVLGLAILREGWMDEFITYVFTDPSRSPSDLYITHWVGEPHAPTYYFGLWAWRKFITPFYGLISVRLLSVLASLVLTAGALYAYNRLVRGRLSVFAVFLLSSPALIFFAEEARSYVFSFFGGVYIGIVFLAALTPGCFADKRSLLIAVLTGAFGGLLCSVHLISVVAAAFCLISLAAIAIWRREWQIAILSGALVVFATILGAASTLLLTSGVPAAMASFWITRRVVLESIFWLPAFVGLPSFVLIAAVISKRSLRSALSVEPLLRPAFYALATSFAFLFLVYAVSVLKPVLTIRYLTAWVGFLIPAMALIAARAISDLDHFREKVVIYAVVVCLIADTAAALITPHHLGAWRAPGLYVQSLPSCRSAIIPVALLTFVPPENEIGAWAHMFAWYAGESDRFVAATDGNLDRAAAQPCPIRLWAAHLRPRYLSPEVQKAFLKTCQHEAVEILSFDSGYLFVAASDHDALSHWTGSRSTCAAVNRELFSR